MTKLLILCHDLSENAFGRALVLADIATRCGFGWRIAGPTRAGIWRPAITEVDVERDVLVLPDPGRGRQRLQTLADEAAEIAQDADLIISVKAHPESLGVALEVRERSGVPVLADIDDPDFDALMGRFAPLWYRTAYRLRMIQRRRSPRTFRELDAVLTQVPRMVSNPTLQRLYGGEWVVPHARPVDDQVTLPDGPLDIAFVGTPRRHKGLDMLRAVVDELPDAVTLTITAPPPRKPRPRERWVGTTDLAHGRDIIRRSQAIVVPISDTGYGRAQLPAKLIDAMALGRPIVASSTAPVRWALGDAGLLVRPDDPDSLREALMALSDARLRRRLGDAAHDRARRMFSTEVVAPTFAAAVRSLLAPTTPGRPR